MLLFVTTTTVLAVHARTVCLGGCCVLLPCLRTGDSCNRAQLDLHDIQCHSICLQYWFSAICVACNIQQASTLGVCNSCARASSISTQKPELQRNDRLRFAVHEGLLEPDWLSAQVPREASFSDSLRQAQAMRLLDQVAGGMVIYPSFTDAPTPRAASTPAETAVGDVAPCRRQEFFEYAGRQMLQGGVRAQPSLDAIVINLPVPATGSKISCACCPCAPAPELAM